MGNLKKENVYVVVDTPKKAKKLKKLLDMFGEKYGGCTFDLIKQQSISEVYLNYFQWNVDRNDAINKSYQTEVSIKELRTILAKEHLKEGDYVIVNIFGIGKIESINGSSFEIDDETFHFDNFKRYATPEEIALLEDKPKELEVGKWYWLNTNNVRRGNIKLQNALIYNNGKDYSYAFNWIGEFIDNFSISNNLENLICEATPQEVESALIKEANRRYKVGDKLKDVNGIEIVPNGSYVFKDVVLYYGGATLMKNGKWATIIEQDKFAELKEAHKNGAVIQFKPKGTSYWYDIPENETPNWYNNTEYRIKPEEKPKVGDVCKFWDEDDSFIIGIYKEHDGKYHRHTAEFGAFDNAKNLTQQEAIDLLFKK